MISPEFSSREDEVDAARKEEYAYGHFYSDGVERTKKNLPKYLHDRLNELDQRSGTNIPELARRKGGVPERMLWGRLVDLGSEEVLYWGDDIVEEFSQVVDAFSILTLSSSQLSTIDHRILLDHLDDRRQQHKENGGSYDRIDLSAEQAQLLASLTQRIGLPYEPHQTGFTVDIPKKIYEKDFPAVTELLGQPHEDQIGHVLSEIGKLDFEPQIKLLLELSDDKFAEFQWRRQERQSRLLAELEQRRQRFPSHAEWVKACNRLRIGTPRYVIAAEVRRRELKWGGYYPAGTDFMIDGMLTELTVPKPFRAAFEAEEPS